MSRFYLRLMSAFVCLSTLPVTATAVTAGSSTAESSPLSSPCDPLGDVNGDGFVTTNDSTLINEMLSSVRVPTEAQVFEADVNNDGKITATDSTEVTAYLQGVAPTFSGCVPYAPALARAERDARRLADLAVIKKALARYAHDTGTLPTYLLLGTPSSDGYWKRNTASSDFRKKLKPYLNPVPVDPLNSQLENFRYVYATLPASGLSKGALCAGNTVLFATRVETSAFGHEECDLGDGKNHFTLIIAPRQTTFADTFFASAFTSLWRLFSLAQPVREFSQ